jgi:DNA-binding MarR family transcriptional regulator
MSSPFAQLDKVLEHSARLHIMSVLAVNESYDFTSLRNLLEITDGSLATHIKALEKEQYIDVKKSFIDRKPSTRYSITDKGRMAFSNHIDALDVLVRMQKKKI